MLLTAGLISTAWLPVPLLFKLLCSFWTCVEPEAGLWDGTVGTTPLSPVDHARVLQMIACLTRSPRRHHCKGPTSMTQLDTATYPSTFYPLFWCRVHRVVQYSVLRPLHVSTPASWNWVVLSYETI